MGVRPGDSLLMLAGNVFWRLEPFLIASHSTPTTYPFATLVLRIVSLYFLCTRFIGRLSKR